jgi:ATP-dependent phosphofructokinase / diphosphate-dependent phosphofructokinase
MSRVARIGILTGGGDAPGLNAVIRAVVKTAAGVGLTCIGLEDSFDGLLSPERARALTLAHVTGIHRIGGTILGTTNRGCPLDKPGPMGAEAAEYAKRCVEGFNRLGLDALVAIGGDGTLAIAHALHLEGIPVVGVPKTIDNDIAETAMSFGFDSAVAFATEAIDRLHASADAHHRIMVVEVMGRHTGWIALSAAIAGGAEVVLIPEVPFDYERVAERLRERDRLGARCSIVVAAEGALPVGGAAIVAVPGERHRQEKLGGIGERLAAEIQARTGQEARFDVLGHLQRGGAPTSLDRVLAARFGTHAVALVRRGQFDVMVALAPPDIVAVPLDRVAGRTRTVPLDSDLIRTARSLGVSFGD